MDPKMKQLQFEDYLSFFQNYQAVKLTYSQLNQILFIHGFVKLSSHTKVDAMNAVSSLDLVMPARSTIRTSTYRPVLPLSLIEAQLDIQEMGWEECPIGSVMGYKATGHSDASDSSSSLSGVDNELTGICTRKKRNVKKELTHDSNAGLVAEQLPAKKMMHVPVAMLKAIDAYSWRGNGTKKKENIVHRWYYRCRTKNCPARKTVHTDPEDSSMCFITYIAEHNHIIPS